MHMLFLHVVDLILFFFFKQKTAYEMRISDWSSDVCSSDLPRTRHEARPRARAPRRAHRYRSPPRLPPTSRRRGRHANRRQADRGRRQAAEDTGIRRTDRKSVAKGNSMSVSVEHGCRRSNKDMKYESTNRACTILQPYTLKK